MRSKPIRPILLAALAVFGLVVSLRAFLGPFTWPVSVNSPINAESWFGLAAAVAFALRAAPAPPKPGARVRWIAVAAMLVLIALAYARALGFYFLSDDFIIVRMGGGLAHDAAKLFTTGGGDGFFRPVGYVSLALTSALAGHNAGMWHAAGLTLHFANTVLVLLLASRVLPSRTAAVVAAALFAIHGARPEAVVWIAARFDLMAAFFVLAGLLLFLRGGGAFKAAAFLCMVLGICSKESAYAFPLLLALLVFTRGERKWRAYLGLAPFLAGAAALFAYRWVLFGAVGGYGASFGLLPSLKALGLRIWAVLFFPLNWSIEPSLVLSALLVVYVAVVAMLACRRPRFETIFPLGFILIAGIPPLSQMLIGPDLLKSRVLYLPSVGFCLLIGGAIAQVADRRWQLAAAAAVLAFHFAALQHNLDAWEYASAHAQRACVAAARCGVVSDRPPGVPHTLLGVSFFANGFRECVEMNLTGPVSDPGVLRWDAARDELRCDRATAAPARPQ